MLFTALSYAQVGINIATPHASSALDITSTSAGVFIFGISSSFNSGSSKPRIDLIKILYFYIINQLNF